MLVTIRTPIVDLRSFYRPDYPYGIRLPTTWSEDKEFVRNFGPVTRRLQGPVDPWTPERVFCRYDRALRFDPSYPTILSRDMPNISFYGVLRRLYPATVRNDFFHADLQMAGRGSSSLPRARHERFRRYSPIQLDVTTTVGLLFSIPATARSKDHMTATAQFGATGNLLAQSFDAATTVGTLSGAVVAGKPAMVIELDPEDRATARWGGSWTVGGLGLLATTVPFRNYSVPVFIIERPSRLDHYQARALRAHLLRLHAEREHLRRTASLLSTEGFIESSRPSQLEAIQGSLNNTLAALTRIRRFGHEVQEISLALMADRTFSGAELETLEQRIQTFRPVIRRRLAVLIEQETAAGTAWNRLLERIPEGKSLILTREVRMSEYDLRGSQIGAVGDNASASNFSFGNQINMGNLSSSEFDNLEVALQTLRQHLADRLSTQSAIEVNDERISPMQIGTAIGVLSEAEQAAASRDEPRAKSALQRCGLWLISFAQEVGVELAASAIRAALHIP